MEGLPSTLTDRLSKEGVTHLFPGLDENNYSGFQKRISPVQRQVIPRLLSLSTLYPRLRPPDVCVAAPTGSGKTLAFVLPIVASLQGRMVPRVRAIAVLPTQDLALQVGFPSFLFIHSINMNLMTTGLSGVQSVFHLLRAMWAQGKTVDWRRLRCWGGWAGQKVWEWSCPAAVGHLGGHSWQTYAHHSILSKSRLVSSEVPGHRRGRQNDGEHSSGITLRYCSSSHDAIDNLAFKDWLNLLENAVYTQDRPRPSPYLTVASMMDSVNLPLQKLLFSATLSHDPEQLEQLNLFEPKLYRCVVPPKDIVGGSTTGKPGEYTFPAELSQQYVITSAQDRLGLITILDQVLKYLTGQSWSHC